MITVVNEVINPRGFLQNQYLAAGQILVLEHRIQFAIGGATFLKNFGTQNTIIADAPVFRFMENGDTIQIVHAGTNDGRVIGQKIDDYTVRLTANLNLASGGVNGKDGFVALQVITGLNQYIRRFLYSLNVNGFTQGIDYNSIVTNYDKTYATPQQGAAVTVNTLPYNSNNIQLQTEPYHKQADSFWHDTRFGYNYSPFSFQGVDVQAVELNIGITSADLAIYQAKGITELATDTRKLFVHHNPLLPNENGYTNQASMVVNTKYRFSRFSGNDLNDLQNEYNVSIDQFGYFGERGNGQVPIQPPSFISVNGGAGFLFDGTPNQELKFRIPAQANGTTAIVYVIFQRWVEDNDFEGFNSNQTYQFNWGVSPIFAFPTNTLTQLGLTNTMISGQCTSIALVGGLYEYTFKFTNTRLADLLTWKYGMGCYVVTETATTLESHLLFRATYAEPIVPPAEIDLNIATTKPYDTEIVDVDDVTKLHFVPTLFLWNELNLEVNDIVAQGARIKRVTSRLRDITDTFDLVRYVADVQGHQVDGVGNPVFTYSQPTQSGNDTNHQNMYFKANAQFSGLEVTTPLLQRIEDWIALQPNAGAYFNNAQPNNGQNNNYYNYLEANMLVDVIYTIDRIDYTYQYDKRLKFADVDVAAPYPLNPPDSTINDVVNPDLTPVTTYYAGNEYVLRLNNIIPFPTEHCVSIRAVYLDQDNIFTWGTWYPDDSEYRPLNTYANVFTSEQPDLYTFTPPRAGRMRFFVIFTKEFSGKDNMICRTFDIEIEENLLTSTEPNNVPVQCCEVLEVQIDDFSTILTTQSTILELVKDGEVVSTITDSTYGMFYPYDTIKGLQIITIDWSKVFALHGLGGYKVETTNFESDLYCLVEEAYDKLIIDLTLNQKVGNLDFISNPVRFYYRLSGFISGDTTNIESEEVKFYNGNILQTKKSNERNYKATVKKCIYRIYSELSNYCVFAKTWKVSDFNEYNPINHKNLSVLPPTALNPEWQYRTNFGILEMDLKRSNSIISGKC